MGVPSDVAHASDWRLSQVWSAALHAHDLRPDGLIYLSRFTGEPNLAVFERALSKLAAAKELQEEFLEREKRKTAERMAKKEATAAAAATQSTESSS